MWSSKAYPTGARRFDYSGSLIAGLASR